MLSFKLTKAARLDPDAFRPPLLTALRKVARNMDKALSLTTKSWEGEKPKFESQTSLTTEAATIQPVMTGPEKGRDKWRFLDEGTRVRYAIMSRDFKAKTMPGVLGSGPGRGGRVFIDVNNPQPGIKARGWSVKVLKEFKPEFRAQMRAALKAGARRAERE